MNRERQPVQPAFSCASIAEQLERPPKEEGRSDVAGGAGDDDAPALAKEEERPRSMSSLMSLLETDTKWEGKEEEDEEDDDDDDDDGGGDGDSGSDGEEEIEHTCCVCMVQHKGAAFVPCGHTFCRLCSKELWVSRGNCPICNGYMLERSSKAAGVGSRS